MAFIIIMNLLLKIQIHLHKIQNHIKTTKIFSISGLVQLNSSFPLIKENKGYQKILNPKFL